MSRLGRAIIVRHHDIQYNNQCLLGKDSIALGLIFGCLKLRCRKKFVTCGNIKNSLLVLAFHHESVKRISSITKFYFHNS